MPARATSATPTRFAPPKVLQLTSNGRQSALHILRAHRLWERYLADATGYSEDEWHSRADEFEHLLSAADADALSAQLGHPTYDPHGDPIPTRDLEIPETSSTRLFDLRAGQSATIQRARDTDSQLLRYLSELGLVPNTQVTVLDFSPLDENLTLSLSGQDESIVLGPQITRQIFVETG